MSDAIVKFWPKEKVSESFTDLIKAEFKKGGIIGEEVDFWGQPAHKAGPHLARLLGLSNLASVSYTHLTLPTILRV